MNKGRFQPTRKGVPQGGPLSPLLANIVLDDLDKELERRGHRFVRYANDFVILTKSQRGQKQSCQNRSGRFSWLYIQSRENPLVGQIL